MVSHHWLAIMRAQARQCIAKGVLPTASVFCITAFAFAAEIPAADEGIRFSCSSERIGKLASRMDAFIASFDIQPEQVAKRVDETKGMAVYTLNTPESDTNTLNLKDRAEFALQPQAVRLPDGAGEYRTVVTVSKKEILLALLQRGRLTVFENDACDLEPLNDNIGIRQNIVAWAEIVEWGWPDGGPAEWNQKYWHRGTPIGSYPFQEALSDIFLNQDKYAIGCYTATKFVVIQGVLDYFRRVRPDPAKLKIIEDRLLMDGEPLVGVEPGKMWHFEKDSDPEEMKRPGKLMRMQSGVAPKNYVPGDWTYFLNTDPVTYEKTGYEGSSTIYLGQNKFTDYFNDHGHSYTFEEKLNEVYQWRNGVFSRRRDADKIKPLFAKDFERLSKTPEHNGISLDVRSSPYLFGYETLPDLNSETDVMDDAHRPLEQMTTSRQ